MNGLAQIYSSWITRFHVDGFRVDTAKHVNAAFFRLWVPKIRAAAQLDRHLRLPDLRRGDADDAVDLSDYVRDARTAAGARLPVPAGRDAPTPPARRARKGSRTACRTTTTSARRTASTPRSRRSSATTTWAGGASRSSAGARARGRRAPQHVELGYDLLYLLRGAPVVQCGDEVGMIGSGGDQAAREDMFPTQVTRLADGGSASAARRSAPAPRSTSRHPLEPQLTALAGAPRRLSRRSRRAHRSCATRSDAVLVVSRIDVSDRPRGRRRRSTTATRPRTSRSAPRLRARPGRSRSGAGTASGNLTLTPCPAVSSLRRRAERRTSRRLHPASRAEGGARRAHLLRRCWLRPCPASR